MKPTSTKIVFFGTEEFSLTALIALIEADYDIAVVITKPDSKQGRGQVLTPPSVKIAASQHNIPVWQPDKLQDIKGDIQALGTIAGVLVSYGKIIPQSIIALFTPGIVNVHPSLLPKYRGPSPIESAIFNGDKTTGVSIMQLSADMDAGPVYAAKEYALNGTETRPQLYQALAAEGSMLLLDVLPSILDGSLQPTTQDDSQATYCELLQKEGAVLDLEQLTAAEAERHVRAYLGFPKSKLNIRGQNLVITKAHSAPSGRTALDFKCKDGAFLCIDELIAPSGRLVDSAAFLRGYAAN